MRRQIERALLDIGRILEHVVQVAARVKASRLAATEVIYFSAPDSERNVLQRVGANWDDKRRAWFVVRRPEIVVRWTESTAVEATLNRSAPRRQREPSRDIGGEYA